MDLFYNEYAASIIVKKEVKIMAYQKPQLLAQSTPQKSYVAGCPSADKYSSAQCRQCDRVGP